jgi:formyltetrahydrofolate hydrolase
MKKVKIAIFASGNGTNAEAIMDYFKNNEYIEVALLLTNNPNAYAIERAKKFGVLCKVFTKQDIENETVVELLSDSGISHVVLAGYLWLIPASLLKAYPNKIVNIHPALLPKYGGKGMYGMKVHEAVKASGDTRILRIRCMTWSISIIPPLSSRGYKSNHSFAEDTRRSNGYAEKMQEESPRILRVTFQ